MAVQRTRADLSYFAIKDAERTVALGDVEIQITQIAWDDSQNRVTLDARVLYQGQLVADDRWHFVNPPQLTGDGTFTTMHRYTSSTDDEIWLSDEQYNALTRTQKRALASTPDTYQHENMANQPRLALMRALASTAERVTKGWTQPRLERIGRSNSFRGDTLTAYAASGSDGYVLSSGSASWTTTQDAGTSAQTSQTSALIEATYTGSLYRGVQYFCTFDTSSLPDDATITGAAYTVYQNGTTLDDTNTTTFEVWAYDYGTSVTTADWRDCNPGTNITGSLTKLASLALSSWTATDSAANNLTDTGAYSSISKTGDTRVVMMIDRLYSASAPTGNNRVRINTADATGTTIDPKLVVTYTPAPTGTIAATLQKALFSGSGVMQPTGTIAATLQKATAAFAGAQTMSGSAAATLQAATFSGTGTQTAGAEGTISSTMQAATASLTGVMEPSGTIAATLQEPTFAATGTQTVSGAVAATMQPATASMTGTQTQTGTIAGTLQPATFAAAGKTGPSGTIVATLQKATAALAGVMQPQGTIAATMAKATFSGAGGQTFLGTIAATLRPATFAGVAVQIYTGTIAATMQAATFAGVGHFDNGGAVLVGIAKKFLARIGILKKYKAEIEFAHTYSVALDFAANDGVALEVARTYEVEILMSNETCYVGNSITATGTFTTVSSGAATDPTTITATVQSPGGVKTSYVYGTDSEMAKSSTGVYTCTFTPTSAGKWIVKFSGAGSVVAVNQEEFTVLTPI